VEPLEPSLLKEDTMLNDELSESLLDRFPINKGDKKSHLSCYSKFIPSRCTSSYKKRF